MSHAKGETAPWTDYVGRHRPVSFRSETEPPLREAALVDESIRATRRRILEVEAEAEFDRLAEGDSGRA